MKLSNIFRKNKEQMPGVESPESEKRNNLLRRIKRFVTLGVISSFVIPFAVDKLKKSEDKPSGFDVEEKAKQAVDRIAEKEQADQELMDKLSEDMDDALKIEPDKHFEYRGPLFKTKVVEILNQAKEFSTDKLIDFWSKIQNKDYFSEEIFSRIIKKVRENPSTANEILGKLTHKGLSAETYGATVLKTLIEKTEAEKEQTQAQE